MKGQNIRKRKGKAKKAERRGAANKVIRPNIPQRNSQNASGFMHSYVYSNTVTSKCTISCSINV